MIKKPRLFYGWWIVLVMFLSAAFGGATIWYGFTALFDPLIAEFAWSYTAISVAASLRGAEFGLMDVVIGFLVDRISSRRIVFFGSILIGIGWLLLSLINSLTTFYIAFFIISAGATGISSVVFFATIARWFRKHLGLALGLASAGFGAGGFAVPFVVYLLDLVGFRMTAVIYGILAFIVGGLTTYVMRNRPEDVGLSPDGVVLSEENNTSEYTKNQKAELSVPSQDYSFKEAISKPTFWIITYISFVNSFCIIMVATHVMPYLEHIGYSRYVASIVAMMIPVTSIGGRLGVGWLSDFTDRKLIMLLTTVGALIGLVLFLYANLSFLLIAFVLLFGISYGGINVIRAAILGDYYGRRNVGSLIGLCLGIAALGGIGGPLLAGRIFDTTNSYTLAWLIIIGLLLVGVPLLLTIKRPPPVTQSSG